MEYKNFDLEISSARSPRAQLLRHKPSSIPFFLLERSLVRPLHIPY
jgi:hypothetical protein